MRKIILLGFLLAANQSFAAIGIGTGTSTVAFAANGASTVTAGTANCTPATTTLGTVGANDIILLVATGEHDRNALALTTANNFVAVANSIFGGDGDATEEDPEIGMRVWWVRGSSWTSAPTVTDTGDHTSCALHRFTGAATSGDPLDVTSSGNDGNANDTSAVIPGATTTVADTLVVLIQGTSFNGTSTAQCGAVTNADLGSITEQFDSTNTSGLGGGHCIITGTKASAGAYGDSTLTLANTSFKGAMSIALKPATGVDLIASVQGTVVSSLTIPALATSGSNRLLFVGSGNSGGTLRTQDSVVRGGSETFTEVWDANNAISFSGGGSYFVNPATASASIVVTFSGSADEAVAGSIAFTGVNSSSPVGTPCTNSSVTTSTSTVTCTAGATDWLVDTSYGYGTTNAVGADQTSRWEQENVGSATAGGSSTQPGTADDVMSWTGYSGGNQWVIGTVPLQEAGGGPACTAGLNMMLLGVGGCP